MLTLVLGGAASGKSEYAEALVLRSALPRYYLATMQVWDAECAARVEKHRKMRAAKQFETIECPLHLETVRFIHRGTALLEDLGNLTANELYDPAGAGDAAAEHILQGLDSLAAQCENLIVVSNEVFSGGADYAGDTDRYLLALAQVNNALAARADAVVRVVCGVPVYYKGVGIIVLQTIAVAFAMFSAVPVPQFGWNEKNMRYALCAFPLVGLLCGVLWCVCGVLPLPAPARAAGFCLVPVWVTGGIHLDGYADTCDALASYGDREKKLEILKDPHCGAFAVIRLCSYFAAYLCLAACVQFTPRVGALVDAGTGFGAGVLRPCGGGLSHGKNTGLAHTFASAADRTAVRNVLTVLAVLLCGALLALGGGALAAVAILLFLWYHHVAVQQLGGITGDLAGWFLQKTELWMLAALCACQWGGLI